MHARATVYRGSASARTIHSHLMLAALLLPMDMPSECNQPTNTHTAQVVVVLAAAVPPSLIQIGATNWSEGLEEDCQWMADGGDDAHPVSALRTQTVAHAGSFHCTLMMPIYERKDIASGRLGESCAAGSMRWDSHSMMVPKASLSACG